MGVSAIFLDRAANLLEEGFNVGIKIGELSDSSMKVIRVDNIRQVTCMSPKYLEKMVLNNFELSPRSFPISHREGRHVATKIRSFLNFIATKFKTNNGLN